MSYSTRPPGPLGPGPVPLRLSIRPSSSLPTSGRRAGYWSCAA